MSRKHKMKLNKEQACVLALSERLVAAQRPIRILDALKWEPQIQEQFFAKKCRELPKVNLAYYQKRPLNFDVEAKQDEFYELERDIRRNLGQFSAVGGIMQRMCREYREVIRLLVARGTHEFSYIAQELYGSTSDVFYAGAPTLNDLADILCETLPNLERFANLPADEKKYTAEDAVKILGARLAHYFESHEREHHVRVVLSDDIVADASAGAESIKLRRDAMFSERDLKVLEVHEGWVHLGTTLNGMAQPICTFLSKGPPSSTVTQEGLAILTEIFTFSSFPKRVQRIAERIRAISMAEQGANFLEVFDYFKSQGMETVSAYNASMRIFRGSTPELGPFTKDLSYSRGFVMINNYIRLAIQRGLLDRIPLLFVGKTTLEDIRILEDLVAEKMVVPPLYVPPQFQDLAALSAWLCFSSFFNKLNLDRFGQDYKELLHE